MRKIPVELSAYHTLAISFTLWELGAGGIPQL